MNGTTVAFTSYAIAAIISFFTAGLMVLLVKVMNAVSKKK
jgi:hypothetical protein